MLRSPELRQLDQRVSIRYDLKPLTARRDRGLRGSSVTIAGGGSAVSFAPKALQAVHRYTGGIPRLINLVCDRALLAAYSERAQRVSPRWCTRARQPRSGRTASSMLQWMRSQAARLF